MSVETLEERAVPAVYLVANTDDAGPGTFRQAILDANANAGADRIEFNTFGTIQLTSADLPALVGEVDIDGRTGFGFAGTPVVAVDFNSFSGLRFDSGASNSILRSLSLVNAGGAGVTIASANNLQIAGNYVGLGLDGTSVMPNIGSGIAISFSSGNVIGGTVAADRNVITGNTGNGIWLIYSSNNEIAGNYIGLNAAGAAAFGNQLDGVRLENSANNLIGHSDPVSSITYNPATSVPTQPVSGWQGIRESDTPGNFLIVGTSDTNGLLFDGTIAGVGTSTTVNYPGAFNTSVYGPDNLDGSVVRLVGSYKNPDYATAAVTVNGFVFEGTTADLNNAANYATISYPGSKYNYVHSTMGGFAVGNYDSPVAHGANSLPLGPGHAFIYDVVNKIFVADIAYPGSLSNTAYGIWHNGGDSYTICGGWSADAVENFDDPSRPLGQAYLVDYDAGTGLFSNWTSFDYPTGTNFVTHFEGISSVEKGVYTLNADSAQSGSSNPAQGSWVSVRRNTDGSFGQGTWVDLNYTGVDPTVNVTSSNSVYGNQVVGIVIGPNPFSYQATINIDFQLSNVISGNGGNGITLDSANDNQVAMNFIGTDATGTVDLGNVGNGVFITAGSARNMIGGQATGGNNPTGSKDPANAVFVRPPQGNLISGNDANGVLINDAATQNILSGNFIGTATSGNAPLGNTLDGVAIDGANANQLIGCTFQQDPFVFYNVIGGNGGNGLRITNANDTTVQANFFGMGANNATPVGNLLDGVLINGLSANTQFGGVIPLGNVVVGNQRNGVEIADTATGTVLFNTFCGLPAFVVTAVPNLLDGVLITSTGGNNLLRTNVISGNTGNGVHLSGGATGVQISEAIIGMDTNGGSPIPNSANGILIDGNAHDNLIGGEQVSVILENTISGNGANGILVAGNAHDIQIFHNFIGTDITGLLAFPNDGAGILVTDNATAITIGGTGTFKKNLISGNTGAGIELAGSSSGTVVINNLIGTDRTGLFPVSNQGAGVKILSSNNQIGGSATGEGNTIAFNTNGATIDTGVGNTLTENSIHDNAVAGIALINNGNNNQTAPTLTGAYQPTSTTIQISGTLNAAPNTKYTVEIFATPSGAPAGQGQNFLGSLTVLTNATGAGTFVLNATYATDSGNSFTATATDPSGNTSAFSPAIDFGANANTIFVASVYGLLLDRVPDPSASSWVDLLNAGTTPQTVIMMIESSEEYLTLQVDAMYLHYLNRAADPAGQQGWIDMLMSGSTLEQVAEGIVSSPEYYQDHGSTNEGYVVGLYEQVLGRTPSANELNSWLVVLEDGASRLTVATAFLTSTEYRTDLINADYETFLNRAPDPDGLAGWLNAFQLGSTDQQVLAGILGSPEGYGIWS